MIKHLIIVGLLTVGSSAAYAQQAAAPVRNGDTQMAAMPSGADAKKLIGRTIKNPQDETIGKIESVYINKDGKVDSVIAGVGGFLGVGEREVRLAWKDLQISQNGERVTVNMTKDQLKAMAPYKYSDATWRGRPLRARALQALLPLPMRLPFVPALPRKRPRCERDIAWS
jgi:PRC-barrel domain